MPKYLIQANYVGEGVAGLMKEGGSKRVAAIESLAASLGGTVEGVYYALGDTDVFVIVDLPDNESAAAISLITNASGVVSVSTTVLLTPEQMDAAAGKTPSYRPPGD